MMALRRGWWGLTGCGAWGHRPPKRRPSGQQTPRRSRRQRRGRHRPLQNRLHHDTALQLLPLLLWRPPRSCPHADCGATQKVGWAPGRPLSVATETGAGSGTGSEAKRGGGWRSPQLLREMVGGTLYCQLYHRCLPSTAGMTAARTSAASAPVPRS